MKENYKQQLNDGFAIDDDLENTKADLDIKDPEEADAELAIAKHVKLPEYTFTACKESIYLDEGKRWVGN